MQIHNGKSLLRRPVPAIVGNVGAAPVLVHDNFMRVFASGRAPRNLESCGIYDGERFVLFFKNEQRRGRSLANSERTKEKNHNQPHSAQDPEPFCDHVHSLRFEPAWDEVLLRQSSFSQAGCSPCSAKWFM